MRPRRCAALVLAAAALAAGCSDDEEPASGSGLSEAEQIYVDEALEGFDAEREAPLTEDDARCMATSMVNEVGVEQLVELGLTPQSFSEQGDLPEGDLPEGVARTLVDGIAECIDFRELFLSGLTQEDAMSPETVECLAEQFDEDLVKRSMVILLSQGEDALDTESGVGAELMAAFFKCPGALE